MADPAGYLEWLDEFTTPSKSSSATVAVLMAAIAFLCSSLIVPSIPPKTPANAICMSRPTTFGLSALEQCIVPTAVSLDAPLSETPTFATPYTRLATVPFTLSQRALFALLAFVVAYLLLRLPPLKSFVAFFLLLAGSAGIACLLGLANGSAFVGWALLFFVACGVRRSAGERTVDTFDVVSTKLGAGSITEPEDPPAVP